MTTFDIEREADLAVLQHACGDASALDRLAARIAAVKQRLEPPTAQIIPFPFRRHSAPDDSPPRAA